MADTYRPFLEKLGGTNAATFVGNKGELFYDPNAGNLKVSDGSTAGGISAGVGAARFKVTGGFTNFGLGTAEHTWTGAGITVTYGAVANYGSFQFTFTMDHDYGDTASYLVLAQCHYHNDSAAGRGLPLVFNLEKVNGTTFIGTASDPAAGVNVDDAKFDLFVFDV